MGIDAVDFEGKGHTPPCKTLQSAWTVQGAIRESRRKMMQLSHQRAWALPDPPFRLFRRDAGSMSSSDHSLSNMDLNCFLAVDFHDAGKILQKDKSLNRGSQMADIR